jgi:hypothetical protein
VRDGGDGGGDASVLAVPAECAAMLAPPSTLACTGLYTDVATKALAPQVRAYVPAVPLWADGSGKDRWIYLPPGTQIDTTDPSNWTFPIGTRVWKQFSRDGARIETRYFQKLPAGVWAYGTFQWSSDESSATISPGGDIALTADGGTYHIPTISECQECHGGSADRLLGFSQTSLGLAGATGLTLDELVQENLLTPVPSATNLTVGDDGTGLAAAPLAWLNINCGMSCHNTNASATASGLGMVLKLDPTQLDGRASSGFPSLVTTVGVEASSPAFAGSTRIVAGDPNGSLVHQLIDERGTIQMPPIASLLVDAPDVAAVAAWIAAMPAGPARDAGADAAHDAAKDAAHDGSHDGAHDSGHDASDGGSDEGSSKDGAVHDANDASADVATDAFREDGTLDGADRDAGAPSDGGQAGDAKKD